MYSVWCCYSSYANVWKTETNELKVINSLQENCSVIGAEGKSVS